MRLALSSAFGGGRDVLTVGSLFSGIGGFDLGLERAGMRSVWFCEADEFCTRVLARHFPGRPIYPDVCGLRGADLEPVDVLCGGFPCQDLSYAGAGAGLGGARSGLWSEYARLVGELRPRYVVVENVAALLARGLGTVLADLAAVGYDAEWDCIPASAVGAPHRRDRIWLVAYPGSDDGGQGRQGRSASGGAREPLAERALQDPDAASEGLEGTGLRGRPADLRADVGDPDGLAGSATAALDRRPGALGEPGAQQRAIRSGRGSRGVGHADGSPPDAHAAPDASRQAASEPGWWSVEPDVGRVAHGVPARVDRLRSLGNALVPQIAEWIGRRIIAYEGGLAA